MSDQSPFEAGDDQEQVPGVRDAPEDVESDLTLCLSGGGFRAAAYHLGVARRLHERGILSQVKRISCVSGGSILGAFLLQRYPAFQGQGSIGFDWEEQIEKPFRQVVCGRDFRTWPILRRWGLTVLLAVMTLAWIVQAVVIWAQRPFASYPQWANWLPIAAAFALILIVSVIVRRIVTGLFLSLVLVCAYFATLFFPCGGLITVIALIAVALPFLMTFRWAVVSILAMGVFLAIEIWGASALPRGRVMAIWILLNGLLTGLAALRAIRNPSSSVECLRVLYVRHLLTSRQDVPLDRVVPDGQPLAFCFNATDIVFGARWVAERHRHRGKYQHRVGSYRAGYGRFEGKNPLPRERQWSLARAIAASTCFPPAFGPMQVNFAASDFQRTQYSGVGKTEFDRELDRERKLEAMMVNDGGNYGNLGVLAAERASQVIVSDGGAPLSYVSPVTPIQLLGRYSGLLMAVNVNQRIREVIKAFQTSGSSRKDGVFVRIGRRLDDDAKTAEAAQRRWNAQAVAGIRTDLDPLTPLEFKAAEELGYASIDEKIERYAQDVAPFTKTATLQPAHTIDDHRLSRRLACRGRRLIAPWLRRLLAR